jgi:hypothetical protein
VLFISNYIQNYSISTVSVAIPTMLPACEWQEGRSRKAPGGSLDGQFAELRYRHNPPLLTLHSSLVRIAQALLLHT